jgi:CBS domain-containing protein
MTRRVRTCTREDSLAHVAWILWDADCGAVPVVDDHGHVTGIVTDRDVCIALGLRNLRARNALVGEVAPGRVYTCSQDQELREALETMAQHQVRRLPVIDDDGKLVGILSINDVLLHATNDAGGCTESVVTTLRRISHHRESTQAA